MLSDDLELGMLQSKQLETGLHAIDVEKRFGHKIVLDKVSLSLQRGEVVGLLGPNGAGKTTLFSILCGLLKPNSGQVLMDGEDVGPRPLYWRAQRGLGYLPQDSSVFRSLTVEQNIRAVLELRGISRAQRREELESLLTDFGLQERRYTRGASLSGGERRRTEVARCLANNPNYILLDEPFAGVDPIAVSDVREMVLTLAKRGIGVLITDHNVQSTLKAVDHATIIHASKVLATGKPEELIENQLVREVYLGQEFGS